MTAAANSLWLLLKLDMGGPGRITMGTHIITAEGNLFVAKLWKPTMFWGSFPACKRKINRFRTLNIDELVYMLFQC